MNVSYTKYLLFAVLDKTEITIYESNIFFLYYRMGAVVWIDIGLIAIEE